MSALLLPNTNGKKLQTHKYTLSHGSNKAHPRANIPPDPPNPAEACCRNPLFGRTDRDTQRAHLPLPLEKQAGSSRRAVLETQQAAALPFSTSEKQVTLQFKGRGGIDGKE